MSIQEGRAEERLGHSGQQQEMHEGTEGQAGLSEKSILELLADIQENARQIRESSDRMLGIP
jgi:hypothetical protein